MWFWFTSRDSCTSPGISPEDSKVSAEVSHKAPDLHGVTDSVGWQQFSSFFTPRELMWVARVWFHTSLTHQQHFSSIIQSQTTPSFTQPAKVKNQAKRQFQKQGCYCLETERHIPPTCLCSTERFISSIHPEQANPQTEEVKHSASGLDPQQSWAQVHPLCHGPISKQLLVPQGKRESGDKTTPPHPHLPAAPAGQARPGHSRTGAKTWTSSALSRQLQTLLLTPLLISVAVTPHCYPSLVFW